AAFVAVSESESQADIITDIETFVADTTDTATDVETFVADTTDTITGFEAFIGGSADDTFTASCTTAAVMTGGDGQDIFAFVAAEGPPPSQETILQITDFEVGDRISISHYDFFKDLADRIEDHMDAYFSPEGNSGRGNNDPVIRFRHEEDNGQENTWIEIDFDRDDLFETTITMQGHHLFVVVDTSATPV
ncbi:MAG: hypothetical protein ACRC6I_11765, partial [Paracoccaceae bacterium]